MTPAEPYPQLADVRDHLVIVTPTRGRPGSAARLAAAVHARSELRTHIVFCVDDDDPERDQYSADLCDAEDFTTILFGRRQSLSGWTNMVVRQLLAQPELTPRYFASLGDDHVPRTPGWDRKLTAAIERMPAGLGFAYGDDKLQGARLPTAWVVSAPIVAELGWMMLPTCEHMYVDNAVLALGTAAGCIAHHPGVVIEHMHPHNGKAEWDSSYESSNSHSSYRRDRVAYGAWTIGPDGLCRDAQAVRTLIDNRRG